MPASPTLMTLSRQLAAVQRSGLAIVVQVGHPRATTGVDGHRLPSGPREQLLVARVGTLAAEHQGRRRVAERTQGPSPPKTRDCLLLKCWDHPVRAWLMAHEAPNHAAFAPLLDAHPEWTEAYSALATPTVFFDPAPYAVLAQAGDILMAEGLPDGATLADWGFEALRVTRQEA